MNPMIKAGLAGLTTLIACSSILSSPAFAIGDTIKTAIDGTFAPHAMPTLDGKIEGFNVDLINLIGDRLGKKVELTSAQFSSLIPALQASTYDFLAAPVTVNKERSASLLFTEGFMDTNFSFVVPANAPDFKSLEDFKGKTIAVNKGSAYDSFLREKEKEFGWKVESYGTNSDAVAAVMAGRADANLAGNTVAAWAVKQNARLKLSYEYATGMVWAFPFRKGDEANRDLVEKAMECLKLDGSMAKLSEKWFGVVPVAGTTIVTPTKGFGTPGFDGYVEDDHKASCDNLK
ncbi:transporter substrate-binding domain-containing protein [Neorhizobium sp. JUb45]|uniref:transporter substrate-binding domain-containing protein n=1 Tax=Neorhizobium sp. JUb45 TaxID=2485113 RepID=UPI00104D6F1D|nr:transporter substrate-binding domain-containing protein [Neorhizobium sp. JUb45]TCR02872.1 amino acid ABC transporter substrate-binding protein (PAAT family) [Neorhizobium sp. JUb45]